MPEQCQAADVDCPFCRHRMSTGRIVGANSVWWEPGAATLNRWPSFNPLGLRRYKNTVLQLRWTGPDSRLAYRCEECDAVVIRPR